MSPCVELVNGGYAHVQWWSILDMLRCSAVVVNVEYAHVQWWSMVNILIRSSGYVHVKSWSMRDMLMCSIVLWWICSCVELVNGGNAHV